MSEINCHREKMPHLMTKPVIPTLQNGCSPNWVAQVMEVANYIYTEVPIIRPPMVLIKSGFNNERSN